MKFCVLTPRFPYPENGGDVLRINNIAKYLKEQGHSLILLSFCNKSSDIKMAYKVYDKVYCIPRNKIVSFINSFFYFIVRKPIQCGYFHSRKFENLFLDVVAKEKPDRFISHTIRMAQYVDKPFSRCKTIVEMTDASSRTYSMVSGAKGNFVKRLFFNIELKPRRKYELDIISKFPKVVLVAQADIDYLKGQNMSDCSSLALHTNGVECHEVHRVVKYDMNKLCFIGNMRTLQNQDAVLYFVEEIFPIILEQRPNAVFYIVGAEPPERIIKLNKKGNVIVTGYVEDLTKEIQNSCVAVAPVRIAGGIQNKILVAMSEGIPVIMTPLIAKAIPELKSGENCVICDDKKEFAASCIELMINPERRESVSVHGFNVVKNFYSWKSKLDGYELI